MLDLDSRSSDALCSAAGEPDATLCDGTRAPQVHASLIVVLTRGGSTARLVAKYRPAIPVLTVAVPVLTTDSLTWTCSGEQPARQCLITRGLLPLLASGSARASDSDTTDEILLVRARARAPASRPLSRHRCPADAPAPAASAWAAPCACTRLLALHACSLGPARACCPLRARPLRMLATCMRDLVLACAHSAPGAMSEPGLTHAWRSRGDAGGNRPGEEDAVQRRGGLHRRAAPHRQRVRHQNC